MQLRINGDQTVAQIEVSEALTYAGCRLHTNMFIGCDNGTLAMGWGSGE